MTRWRIWAARKILGQHGVIFERYEVRDVVADGGESVVIQGNTFTSSGWTLPE